MVGDSAGLRQEADAAKQAFASLSQKVGGLQGKLDRAGEDEKSFIEGQIEALRASLGNAAGEVNRTSSEYATAVAQERNEEFMEEIKQQEELIEKEAKEAEEKAILEQEKSIESKDKGIPDHEAEDLMFLSEAFGTAGGDTVDFSNSSVGADKAAGQDAEKTETKDEPTLKAAGTASTSA